MQLQPRFRRVHGLPAVFHLLYYGIAAVPDLDVVAAKGGEAGGNGFMRHFLGRQHLSDAMVAIPFALELFHVGVGKTLVVQVTKSQAPLDGPLDLILGESSVNQLAGQFGTTVVPSRQQPQCNGKTASGIGLILHGQA